AFDAGLREVVLEVDSAKLYKYWSKGITEPSYFGLLVRDILYLAKQCKYITFSHVRREGNKVAHELAKISSNYGEMMIWMEECPDEVRSLVIMDASLIN
ncbi:hypothetical protein RDABS01_025914, partial [Bienertia sinuspersici]